MARFAGAHEPATPDEGSLTLSSAVSTVTYPVRYASHMLYEAVPFTKKGATVLLKGKPAIESVSGGLQHAALTAVRFRGKIRDGEEEAGRYFLLASYGDPWAQRALIVHELAGLTQSVGVVTTDGLWPIAKGLPAIATRGWKISTRKQVRNKLLGSCSQELQCSARRGSLYMHDLYAATDPEATGRVTIPCIWDSLAGKVVNNESGDIIRILHQGLRSLGESAIDLYPVALQDEIERVRQIVYGFNAGVYKCGFAATPEAHQRALSETFAALDTCEALLASREYLAGGRLTECDVLAFPTLIRFDVSYYTAFRCNRRRIRDYPNISRYTERLYSIRAFRETVHMPTYVCVHFIEARWRGRTVGTALRLIESLVETVTGAALPGASWIRRTVSRVVTLPARLLSSIFT
eukprot:Tamp_15394.p1 GENE.Tamp_15394~~Tamp_15394.p1  ORF type:complete len:424 (+),score=50.23 Tamp_15394:52-1272(+)